MKNLILITILSLFIFATGGCKSGLSPDSVTVDNPATVEQLVDAVMADEAAWKGKKVAVAGRPSSSSKGSSGYKMTLKSKDDPDAKVYVGCDGEGELPDNKELYDKDTNWVFEGEVEGKFAKDRVILINCKPIKK